MDQKKIGKFISILRKEKGMTQEQLAERLGVSNRSVSRWENGTTMPDLALLQILSEELGVTVSELLNGQCSEEELQESKEGIGRIIEFSDQERIRKAKKSNRYFFGGLLCIVIVILHGQFGILSFLENANVQEFAEGVLIGLGLSLEIAGFYFNGRVHQFTTREIEVISGDGKYAEMKTAGEMLQFARKNQKAELKQYEKAFRKIEEQLLPEETVIFSMVAEEYTVNDHPALWHVSVAVTGQRLLVGSEQIRGRMFTGYEVESFELSEMKEIGIAGKELQIKTDHSVIKLKGKGLEQFLDDFKQLIEK